MSEAVTEIALIPLVPGTDPTTGDTKSIWDETLGTIASQPGCQSIFWGRQVENPDIAQLVIGWDKLESHNAFMASPAYGPFFEKFKPIAAGTPQLYHLKLASSPSSTTPLLAPVTECISLYFEPSHSTSAYDANFSKFASALTKVTSETQGIVGAWGIEEHKHETLAKEGETEGDAKLYGAFIGWPTVDAHMDVRNHEDFSKVVEPFRDGRKGAKMWHVAFEKYL